MIPLNKQTKFYNYPYNLEEADITLFGAPYKPSEVYTPTRYKNTDFLREASTWIEDNSLSTPQYYSSIKVYDAGDIQDPNDIENLIKIITKNRGTPVMFGGPHKYTYYTVKTLKPDTLIVLDAHLDLKKEFLGEKFSNATFIRNLSDEKVTKKIIFIGARAYEEEEREYLDRDKNIVLITPNELSEYIDRNKTIYLTLDIDFLDSSYISETPYPEAWGYTPTDLINILKTLIKKKVKLVGADVMEYITLEGRHAEAKLVSRLILEVISTINYLENLRE